MTDNIKDFLNEANLPGTTEEYFRKYFNDANANGTYDPEFIRKNTGYNVRELGEILYAGYEPKAPQQVLDAINQEYGTKFTNDTVAV